MTRQEAETKYCKELVNLTNRYHAQAEPIKHRHRLETEALRLRHEAEFKPLDREFEAGVIEAKIVLGLEQSPWYKITYIYPKKSPYTDAVYPGIEWP